MKLKLGLKHYDVLEVTNLKQKLSIKKDSNTILYYPKKKVFLVNNNYHVFIANNDYQVENIYRNITKNKLITLKKDQKKIFLIPKDIKEKLVIGSILKLEN